MFPFTCTVSSLPLHGYVSQPSTTADDGTVTGGSSIITVGTVIVDPFCRTTYAPDGFAVGTGADTVDISALWPTLPSDTIRFFAEYADKHNGGVAVTGLWSSLAQASCNQHSASHSDACMTATSSAVIQQSVSIAASNLVPRAFGRAAEFGPLSYINLTAQRPPVAVDPDGAVTEYSVILSVWLQPRVACSGVIAAMYFANRAHVTVVLSADCVPLITVVAYGTVVQHATGNGSIADANWHKLAVVIGDDAVCLYADGVASACTDTGTAAVPLNGSCLDSVIVGAEVISDAVSCVDSPVRNGITCNHYHGLLDDVMIVAIEGPSDGISVAAVAGVDYWFDWAQPNINLGGKAALLCALPFDSPLSLLWQPSLVTDTLDAWNSSDGIDYRKVVPVSAS